MNPKEFGWKEDQQVTVTNPTEEDFRFKVHGKDYMVEKGTTAKMPGYIAWLYVYNLATQMAQKAGDFVHWNEEGFRQQYYDRIVVGADQTVQVVQPEPTIEKFSVEEPEKSPDSEVKAMEPRRGRPTRNT
jgi:hypothetical protein